MTETKGMPLPVERSPVHAPKSNESEEDRGAARLQLLSAGDLNPASDSRWLLSAHDDRSPGEQRVVADAQGVLWVPAGRWGLTSADGEWAALDAEFEAFPGAEGVLWVQRLGSRRFLVSDVAGNPIEAVRATWLPRRATEARGDTTPLWAESDSTGLVEFPSCPCENGTAVFLHPDYEREELSLCGRPEGTARVVLRPASVGRALHFTRMDSVTPVQGIVLESPQGYEVARSSPGSASLVVPSWVRGDEPLLVTSPTTFPSLLRLSGVRGDDVALPGRRTAWIRVEDSTGCSERVTLVVRVMESNPPAEVEPKLQAYTIGLAAGSQAQLDLPSDRGVVLWAQNPCGAFDDAEVPSDDGNFRVTLSLRTADPLVIHVTNANGVPIPSARASPDSGGAFEADESGRIRIPTALDLTSFDISAEGYCRVVVSRNRAAPTVNLDQEVPVTLAPSIEATFVVRSPDGDALPGMLVRVWPLASPGVVPSPNRGAWTPGRVRSSVAGVTDASGRCVCRGVPAGWVEVEVSLAQELGTDPYLRSAYPSVVLERMLAHDGEFVLEAPRPVNLSLEVVDRSSGNYVRGFELRAEDPAVPPVLVRGGFWQGWISSDLDRLWVDVEGLGSELIQPRRLEDGSPQRVVVGHSAQIPLRLLNLPESARGTDLRIEVMHSTPDGLHFERAVFARPDESGEAFIELGDTLDLWIGIASLEVSGQRLRFEPEFQAAGSGSAVVFRCVSE